MLSIKMANCNLLLLFQLLLLAAVKANEGSYTSHSSPAPRIRPPLRVPVIKGRVPYGMTSKFDTFEHFHRTSPIPPMYTSSYEPSFGSGGSTEKKSSTVKVESKPTTTSNHHHHHHESRTYSKSESDKDTTTNLVLPPKNKKNHRRFPLDELVNVIAQAAINGQIPFNKVDLNKPFNMQSLKIPILLLRPEDLLQSEGRKINFKLITAQPIRIPIFDDQMPRKSNSIHQRHQPRPAAYRPTTVLPPPPPLPPPKPSKPLASTSPAKQKIPQTNLSTPAFNREMRTFVNPPSPPAKNTTTTTTNRNTNSGSNFSVNKSFSTTNSGSSSSSFSNAHNNFVNNNFNDKNNGVSSSSGGNFENKNFKSNFNNNNNNNNGNFNNFNNNDNYNSFSSNFKNFDNHGSSFSGTGHQQTFGQNFQSNVNKNSNFHQPKAIPQHHQQLAPAVDNFRHHNTLNANSFQKPQNPKVNAMKVIPAPNLYKAHNSNNFNHNFNRVNQAPAPVANMNVHHANVNHNRNNNNNVNNVNNNSNVQLKHPKMDPPAFAPPSASPPASSGGFNLQAAPVFHPPQTTPHPSQAPPPEPTNETPKKRTRPIIKIRPERPPIRVNSFRAPIKLKAERTNRLQPTVKYVKKDKTIPEKYKGAESENIQNMDVPPPLPPPTSKKPSVIPEKYLQSMPPYKNEEEIKTMPFPTYIQDNGENRMNQQENVNSAFSKSSHRLKSESSYGNSGGFGDTEQPTSSGVVSEKKGPTRTITGNLEELEKTSYDKQLLKTLKNLMATSAKRHKLNFENDGKDGKKEMKKSKPKEMSGGEKYRKKPVEESDYETGEGNNNNEDYDRSMTDTYRQYSGHSEPSSLDEDQQGGASEERFESERQPNVRTYRVKGFDPNYEYIGSALESDNLAELPAHGQQAEVLEQVSADGKKVKTYVLTGVYRKKVDEIVHNDSENDSYPLAGEESQRVQHYIEPEESLESEEEAEDSGIEQMVTPTASADTYDTSPFTSPQSDVNSKSDHVPTSR